MVISESLAGYHPVVELIIFIQLPPVLLGDEFTDFFVGEGDAIVAIAGPEDKVVVADGTVPGKAKAMIDGVVVEITLVDVAVAGCQMGCYKAN